MLLLQGPLFHRHEMLSQKPLYKCPSNTVHSHGQYIFIFCKCGWMRQLAKHSPSVCEAPGLKPSTAKSAYYVLFCTFIFS